LALASTEIIAKSNILVRWPVLQLQAVAPRSTERAAGERWQMSVTRWEKPPASCLCDSLLLSRLSENPLFILC